MLKKRIFVSFAIEDERTRDLFVGQSRNTKTPFDFIDMSVKKPWDEEWKRNCRTRIKGCDGFIVLITKNLKNGSGALWEIKCAIEEGIPLLGVYCGGATLTDQPDVLLGKKKINWIWEDIGNFIDGL
jgi:hypothetical protein